jgi:ribA/ribD-fused uncharacterized protein
MRVIDALRGEYAFLSNFHVQDMEVDGKVFASNEHFFQASKAQNTDDFEAVRLTPTPGASKRMGRAISLRPDWETVKNDVMLKGLRAKFSDPALRAKLLATETAQLVEGNKWCDTWFGRCDCAKHGGDGANYLGRLLMQVREELRVDK